MVVLHHPAAWGLKRPARLVLPQALNPVGQQVPQVEPVGERAHRLPGTVRSAWAQAHPVPERRFSVAVCFRRGRARRTWVLGWGCSPWEQERHQSVAV